MVKAIAFGGGLGGGGKGGWRGSVYGVGYIRVRKLLSETYCSVTRVYDLLTLKTTLEKGVLSS